MENIELRMSPIIRLCILTIIILNFISLPEAASILKVAQNVLGNGIGQLQKIGNKVADKVQEEAYKAAEKNAEETCKKEPDSENCKKAQNIATGAQAVGMTLQTEINNSVDAAKTCIKNPKLCRKAVEEDIENKKGLIETAKQMAGKGK